MKNNLLTLNEKCILNDHALLTLDQFFESEESIEIRDKFNNGEPLTTEDFPTFWENFVDLETNNTNYTFSVSFPMRIIK